MNWERIRERIGIFIAAVCLIALWLTFTLTVILIRELLPW